MTMESRTKLNIRQRSLTKRIQRFGICLSPSHKNYMHEGSVIIQLTLSLNVFGGRQTKQTYLVNLSLN
jgi:hypothetical protein